MRQVSRALAGSLALLLATPALTGAAAFTNSFDVRVLGRQNAERAAMGVPPLHWNAGLAASAQGWADHLAATGAFEHAPERAVDPEGENLWAGSKSRYSPEDMVDAWVREKAHYRPGVFPDNSTTGRTGDVGHYTQLIWRRTLQVGCARATSAEEDVLVCRYSEAGNYVGENPLASGPAPASGAAPATAAPDERAAAPSAR